MADTASLCYSGVHDLSERIRRKQISPVEVVDAFLQRIEALNPKLSAYLTLTASSARERAKRAEAEIAAGKWRGPLHGIPYGAKDLLAAVGAPTTWGAAPLRRQVFDFDATVI